MRGEKGTLEISHFVAIAVVGNWEYMKYALICCWQLKALNFQVVAVGQEILIGS